MQAGVEDVLPESAKQQLAEEMLKNVATPSA